MMSILDLPCDDVFHIHILPLLGPKDVFNLRATCTHFKSLTSEYLKGSETLDISTVSRSVTEAAFKIFTKDACNLKRLNVRGSKWLYSSVLDPVLKTNDKLEYLNIGNCTFVQSSSLLNLPRTLTSLSLCRCYLVNDEAVFSIAKTCYSLESLELSSCWEVRDEAVCELVCSCRRLKHLSLSSVYKLTDNSLKAISRYLNLLEDLDLRRCWRISDFGLKLVRENCRHLKSLQFENCTSTTEFGLLVSRSKLEILRTNRFLSVTLPWPIFQ